MSEAKILVLEIVLKKLCAREFINFAKWEDFDQEIEAELVEKGFDNSEIIEDARKYANRFLTDVESEINTIRQKKADEKYN